jgi:hypothetical protein
MKVAYQEIPEKRFENDDDPALTLRALEGDSPQMDADARR